MILLHFVDFSNDKLSMSSCTHTHTQTHSPSQMHFVSLLRVFFVDDDGADVLYGFELEENGNFMFHENNK